MKNDRHHSRHVQRMNRIVEEDNSESSASPSNSRRALRQRKSPPLEPSSPQGNKENETPRMWKEGSSVAENVARRKSSAVPFLPMSSRLSYFSVQESLMKLERTNEMQDVDLQNDEPLDAGIEKCNHEVRESASHPPRNGNPFKLDFTSPPRPVISRKNGVHNIYEGPTYLHDVCHSMRSLEDLKKVNSHIETLSGREVSSSASRKDDEGRIPIHIFSENKGFAETILEPQNYGGYPILQSSSFLDDSEAEKQLIRFVLKVLLAAHPNGMIWRDNHNFIPFERALFEWVSRAHEIAPEERRKRWSNRTLTTQAGQASTIQSMWQSTTFSMNSAFAWASRSVRFPNSSSLRSLDSQRNEGDEEAGSRVVDESDNTTPVQRGDRGENWKYQAFPVNIRLSARVVFSIKILSLILEQLDEYVVSRSFKRRSLVKPKHDEILNSDSFDVAMDDLRSFCIADKSEEIVSTIVGTFAATPNLIKTILLLQDEHERDWVLSTTWFRAVMLSKNSVRPWLTAMLQSSSKNVSSRALAYLTAVSDAVEAEEKIQHSKSAISVTKAKRPIDDFEEEVSKLEGFIQSLLSLDEWGIEKAATTLVVQRVLDRMISRPFAVTVVFFDAVFLALLIVSFRAAVGTFLQGRSPDTVLKWIYLANAGIFYFIIRELGKGITILERTKQARAYLWSFWNITDILSTVFALCSSIGIRVSFGTDGVDFSNIDPLRGLLAVTTGFLWLRVLSLLKSINMQLATFVLAILQITRDILWFLLILIAAVVAFAQMFYTLLLPATCASDERDPDDLVCKPSEYYLKTYTILLGDFGTFERESFQSWFGVFLVCFFSFMVVVVLLNVLIAIVSDSYEKCLLRSASLFGRARVMLVAELVSFQNLLRKHETSQDGQVIVTGYSSWWSRQSWDHGWSRGSVVFFVLSATVIFTWIVGETAGYFSGERYGNFIFSIGSIVLNVVLYAAIIVFLSNGAAGEPENSAQDDGPRRKAGCIWGWYNRVIQKAMLRLLSSTQETTTFFKQGADDEWKGRVHYMQKEVSRTADESNALLEEQTSALEKHLAVAESRLCSEMSELEQRMLKMKADILEVLKASEERAAAIHQATLNRLLEELGKREIPTSSSPDDAEADQPLSARSAARNFSN